jgi:hypothetical protein
LRRTYKTDFSDASAAVEAVCDSSLNPTKHAFRDAPSYGLHHFCAGLWDK